MNNQEMTIMNNMGAKNSMNVANSGVFSNLAQLSGSNLQISIALIFGVMLVAIVGLAPMEVLHNAAHDVRHVFAFPCH